MTLNEIRERWTREAPLYQSLVSEVQAKLEDGIARLRRAAIVTGRVKELASVLKKYVRKKYRRYSQITDNAGVRVIVLKQDDLAEIESLLERLFIIKSRIDKGKSLKPSSFGYRSIHYQVLLRNPPPQLRKLSCEVQVRTLCEHVWAELSHAVFYKKGRVPPDLMRRLSALGALFELADRELTAIWREAQAMPEMQRESLLDFLESEYYKLGGLSFDRELSWLAIEILLAVYSSTDTREVRYSLEEFLNNSRERVRALLQRCTNMRDRLLFLYQPEVIMILDRLEHNPSALRKVWVGSDFPEDQLLQLAIEWGKPYYD